MEFKYIMYQDKKLYKLYPHIKEINYLTADSLRIIINSARYEIRVSKKRFDYNMITKIYNEVEEIYNKFSVKNKTSIKQYEAFNRFMDEILLYFFIIGNRPLNYNKKSTK